MNKEKLIQSREWIRAELDRCVSFWLENGMDRENGGVYTCLDRQGKVFSTDKSVWMQGRCGWIFAYLCHAYGVKEEWLEASRSCLDFMEAHCFNKEAGDRMYFTVTADGDGFSAATLVQVSGGSGKLTCGGGADNGETHSDGFDGGFGGWGGGWNNDTATDEETVSTKGFKGGTALLCTGGTWTLDTADDSLHSNGDVTVSGGTLTVATGDDGIHADGTTTIKDGSVTVTHSYEGIEGNAIEILGGRMKIVASDDGLNAAGGNDESGYGGRYPDQFNDNNSDRYIRIRGGHLTVDAGGDGIDANGALYVEGGETYVSGPTNSGNGPLDYDGQAQVTGGVFVAVGARGMDQGFTSAENQGAALLNTNASVNGELVLRDSKGKELLRWTPAKTYSSIAITCPELTKGVSYTLTAGDEELSFELTDWIYGSFGGGPGGGRPDGGWGGGPGGMGKPGR